MRNTELNDGTSTGESPEKIFLDNFGGFWVTDKEVNTSFERKVESAPPPKKKVLVSQLSFVNGVKTIINHTTFESPSGERGLRKHGQILVCKKCNWEDEKIAKHIVPTALSYA